MNVNYYLEIRNTQDDFRGERAFPVVLSCTHRGKRLKMHTGFKVVLSEWDKERQRVKPCINEAFFVNSYLDKLKELCNQAFLLHGSDADVNVPLMLKTYLKSNMPKSHTAFFHAFMEFIEENHQGWKKLTFYKVKSLYRLLREFDERNEHKLQLLSFDETHFKNIAVFFRDVKGFADITTEKYMGILKWFLNWAIKKKYYFNPGIRFMKLETRTVPAERKINNYLTREELLGLHTMKGLSKREERITDIFVFQCFTGIRHNEMNKLKKSDIRGDTLLLFSGDGQRTVPLNRFAMSIIKKYENIYFRGDKYFPCFSIMTMNKYIRNVAHKAEMNRLIRVKGRGKRGVNDRVLKDVIAIGFARNTFLANALMLGVSEETLRRVAGLRTSSVLKRVKDSLEVADRKEMLKFNRMAY